MRNNSESRSVVTIYYADQCDRKKCTGMKTWRSYNKNKFPSIDEMKFVRRISQIPRFSLILNPLAAKILCYEDQLIFSKSGLTVLDCSWNHTEEIFTKKFPNLRRLPCLIAANPTNYGKPTKLTSVEALVAGFILLRNERAAKELLSVFKWGKQFLTLNSNLLSDYAACTNTEEIKEIEREYFNSENT